MREFLKMSDKIMDSGISAISTDEPPPLEKQG
jgi:hypothetical protein